MVDGRTTLHSVAVTYEIVKLRVSCELSIYFRDKAMTYFKYDMVNISIWLIE